MSEGINTPWHHETNLIVSDKDKQGQTWREYVKENISKYTGDSIDDVHNRILGEIPADNGTGNPNSKT